MTFYACNDENAEELCWTNQHDAIVAYLSERSPEELPTELSVFRYERDVVSQALANSLVEDTLNTILLTLDSEYGNDSDTDEAPFRELVTTFIHNVISRYTVQKHTVTGVAIINTAQWILTHGYSCTTSEENERLSRALTRLTGKDVEP